jgi:putative sterol carrier protein
VTYPFLSDEWIAAVTEIGDRYKVEGIEAAEPQQIKLNVNVTEVPFGDGTLSVGVDSTNGRMHFQRGEVSDPDVTVTTDYTTARSILVDQDPAAAMQAFMTGKVRVQGNMMKLMQLQPQPGQPGQSDGTAQKVAEEIKAITA